MIRKLLLGLFIRFRHQFKCKYRASLASESTLSVTVADLPRPETLYPELENILINAGDRALR